MKHSFKEVIIFSMFLNGIIILIPRTALNIDITTSKNKEKPIIRKTYIPELVIDCHKGDIDENCSFHEPLGILTDSKGNIFLLDCKNNKIVKYDKDLHFIKSVGGKGNGPGQFIVTPGLGRSNLAIDSENSIYLIDNINYRINIYSQDLHFIRSFSTLTIEYFSIAVDSNKNIYLTKNPSTSLDFGDLFTIHKYSNDHNGCSLVKKFGESITWTPQGKLSNYEYTQILNLSRSSIRINSNDEIFQLFYHLPVLRKYNNKGDRVFNKIIAPEIIKEAGWKNVEFMNILSLNKASSESIRDQKRFKTFQDFCINQKKNTLLLLMHTKNVLELDFSCEAKQLLIPDKTLSNLSNQNHDDYCFNLNKGNFSFTYNNYSDQLLFLGWNSGEIWIGHL